MRRLVLPTLAAVCLAATAASLPSEAAFPGRPGKLVFDSSPSDCFDGGIWVAPPNLRGKRFLGRGGNAQFSPNGEKIAYETCDGLNSQIELINRDGTGHRVLVPAVGFDARSAAEPTFSPDGRRVLFTRYAGAGAGQTDLWTVRLDGTGLRELTHTRASEENPAWSPTGRIIVFAKNGGLFTMRPDGSRVRRLTRFGGRPAFSPNGHLIAFTRRYGARLYVIRPNSGGLREIERAKEGQKISGPAFSPNGKKIVYTLERHAFSFPRRADLYTIRPDGSGIERIRGTNIDEYRVDWGVR
jgi:TolB protein